VEAAVVRWIAEYVGDVNLRRHCGLYVRLLGSLAESPHVTTLLLNFLAGSFNRLHKNPLLLRRGKKYTKFLRRIHEILQHAHKLLPKAYSRTRMQMSN
jgi:hypothetical protein